MDINNSNTKYHILKPIQRTFREERDHLLFGGFGSFHGAVCIGAWFGESNGHERQEEARQSKYCEHRQRQGNRGKLDD